MLDPEEILKLNDENPDISSVSSLVKLLSENIVKCDTLILSHELLFDCPRASRNICSIARDLVSTISIIGYCRKQSGLMTSVYSQWLFRLPHRVKEATDVLIDFGLDPILFTGLERQFIASIANDFFSARQITNNNILDWHASYQNVERIVHESGAAIECGLLPDNDSSKSLIQDFCEKAGLTLQEKMEKASKKIVNISFNHDLVEAINSAVTIGLTVPGPHDCNEDFEKISAKLSPSKFSDSEFITNLKAYVDTAYLNSNHRLCDAYGFDKNYFLPTKQFSKPQIMDIIQSESEHRRADKSTIINRFRMLSASMALACFETAKNELTN